MSSKGPGRDVQHAVHIITLRSDRLLAHLSRILATPAGTDKLLQTLQYTLLVLHSQVSRLRDWRVRTLVFAIARKASTTLLPGEKIVATVPSPTPRLDNIIGSSKALSSLISDFRIFTRLWGLLGCYDWAKSTWHNPPQDIIIRAAVWAQVVAGFGFQWYENVAYLAMKGVLRGERFNERNQARWWEWSSRFWMAHVALEVVRLGREWQLVASEDESDDSAEAKAHKVQADAAWRRDVAVNAAWAPVTAHYSWEQGCLSEPWVGLFGAVASGIGFRQLWRRTT